MSWVEFSEVVRNFAIVIGGAFGLWLAWQRSRASNVQAAAARDQAALARRDHVVELFNRAVEQLGHDRLEVRLGAIYTLREIDRDFSDLCGPVFELLSAYVRERTKATSEETPQIDTAAIIEFLRNKLSSPKSGG
jgi:hypothetical protein